MKFLYKTLGLLAVGLAFLGAVLPLLPTTPFLLLALWLFARSSEKLRRWIITNRLFGKYIDDYSSGRGVPVRVKIVTLAMLWASIGYSALWVVNALWVRILLLSIAIGVTIHILMLRTKRDRRVVVLVPTEGEAAGFATEFDATFVDAAQWRSAACKGAIAVVVGGVGMAETAAAVVKIVNASRRAPEMIVLAGIAGASPTSGLVPGDCVVVVSERVCDLGAMRDGRFVPLYGREYTGGAHSDALPSVAGGTVSCCGFGATDARVWPADSCATTDAERIDNQVESMEGAAFFAVCEAFGVPFMEVRAVSNITTDSRSEWQVERALAALAAGVKKCIDSV